MNPLSNLDRISPYTISTISTKVLQKTQRNTLIEGIYTLMATLRSAKHQQLMFLLKHSVSKVKKYTSFTNLLLII